MREIDPDPTITPAQARRLIVEFLRFVADQAPPPMRSADHEMGVTVIKSWASGCAASIASLRPGDADRMFQVIVDRAADRSKGARA